jgi:hypothetical protein
MFASTVPAFVYCALLGRFYIFLTRILQLAQFVAQTCKVDCDEAGIMFACAMFFKYQVPPT